MPPETSISAITPTPTAITHTYADMTVTISIILAISAIIVPAVVAYLNNRKEIKLKQLELERSRYEHFLQHRQEVFEKYLFEAGQAIGDKSFSHLETYSPSYFVALAYAPKSVRSHMEIVNISITDNDFESASMDLEETSAEIYNYLETAKIPNKPSKHIWDKFCSLVRRNGPKKSQ